MKYIGLITVRTSSSRLPAKCLFNFGDVNVITHLINENMFNYRDGHTQKPLFDGIFGSNPDPESPFTQSNTNNGVTGKYWAFLKTNMLIDICKKLGYSLSNNEIGFRTDASYCLKCS